MSLWQVAILTAFSCLSLIIALYCLFFMLPVKRFHQRIESLGGGIKGVEAHLDGVRDDIAGRLASIEEGARQSLATARQELQEALDRLGRDGHGAQRDLEGLRKDLLALQAELRNCAGDTRKLGQAVEALSGSVEQLRGDFGSLDAETRRAVRQQVAESFTSVESTVLSALDALQEEVLYATSGGEPGSPGSRQQAPAQTEPLRPAGGKIIPAEPLFANLRRNDADGEEESATEDDEDD